MKMKLLIVDDNAAVRQMIRRFVAGIADEINEIDDGAYAVAAYTMLLPDWVLMDIEMKHVNGIVATAEIKAVFPRAKILIVTNHNDDGLRERAALAGACGYVLKEDLMDLRQFLTGGRQITLG
jgi:DNA-binding NarL/FixJ family response regulator